MLARSCTAVTAASMVSWWSSLERDIVKSDDFHNGNSFLAYAGRRSLTREAEGSGNSLLLNLTESHFVFKLNTSTLILSCRFYESSAKSEEKTKSFLGIAISLKRSPYQTSALAVHKER